MHRALLRATVIVAFAACSNTAGPSQPRSEGAVGSTEARSFHLTKECSEYLGQAGDHCTVIKSNVELIPPGATVTYLVVADLVHGTFDGDVVLRTSPGDAAFGHCIISDPGESDRQLRLLRRHGAVHRVQRQGGRPAIVTRSWPIGRGGSASPRDGGRCRRPWYG